MACIATSSQLWWLHCNIRSKNKLKLVARQGFRWRWGQFLTHFSFPGTAKNVLSGMFLLLTMGMNNATSTYSCLWCTVCSSERWDMSIVESVFTEKKARSLSTLWERSHFANKPCHQHLGSIHPPLLNIELTKVVVDELHLLLRVTDVLIRNLISLAASRDHEEQQRQGETSNHIRPLEQAVQSCKMTFTIWQRVDGDGRPQPGKYDCTSLNGTDRLRVLHTLPAKFDTILPGDLAVPMVQFWNDFTSLHAVVSK